MILCALLNAYQHVHIQCLPHVLSGHPVRGHGGRGQVLSTIDLTKGYWQIPLAPDACEKTLGCMGQLPPSRGPWVKPFCAVAYIDDILAFSLTLDPHLIRQVFQALHQAGLTATQNKNYWG